MPALCPWVVALVVCLGAPVPALAEAAPPDRAALTVSLQKIVDDYLAVNASVEGVTAVSASISLPGGQEPNINVVAGHVSKAKGATPVTPDSLVPIGSITKSMTSTVVLQLVREGSCRSTRRLARGSRNIPRGRT